MVLDNLSVRHKSFGVGTVVATSGKYMTVRFDGVGDKSFVYPDSFERFLTLADGTVSDEIVTDIEASRAQRQQIIDMKQQENLHSMMHGIVIPGKETSEDDEDEHDHESKGSHDEI